MMEVEICIRSIQYTRYKTNTRQSIGCKKSVMTQETHFPSSVAEKEGRADGQSTSHYVMTQKGKSEMLPHNIYNNFSLYRSQISEPSVVEKSVCGQYEGLRLQLHLHASVLHEAWHRPVAAGVLRPGGHLLQPHHALCQPRILAHGRKILESPQCACQTSLHGALLGQLGLGAVWGSDCLRLLAIFCWPRRAAGQPPLLRQHPAL